MDIDLLFLVCGALHFTPQQSLFFGSILIAILLVWLFSIIAAFVSFCFLGHFHKLIIIILSVTYGTVNASSHRDGQTEKIY
jgi:hypothetical protein